MPDTATAGAADALRRTDFRHFLAIPTRWMDNDIYGHINNVTYYSYFDTVVNEHLIRAGGLDIVNGPAIGYVVENSCTFRKPLAFPDTIDAGLRVTKLGTSSVVYEIGLFRRGDDDAAAASEESGLAEAGAAPAKLALSPPGATEREFEPLAGSLGEVAVLDEAVHFAGVDTAEGTFEQGTVQIVFQRDGTSDPAAVVLESDGGRRVALYVAPLADAVRFEYVDEN